MFSGGLSSRSNQALSAVATQESWLGPAPGTRCSMCYGCGRHKAAAVSVPTLPTFPLLRHREVCVCSIQGYCPTPERISPLHSTKGAESSRFSNSPHSTPPTNLGPNQLQDKSQTDPAPVPPKDNTSMGVQGYRGALHGNTLGNVNLSVPSFRFKAYG